MVDFEAGRPCVESIPFRQLLVAYTWVHSLLPAIRGLNVRALPSAGYKSPIREYIPFRWL